MKILFFLINMNLGGTEKSFLNLLETLPQDCEIDLVLLEKKGALLDKIPSHITIHIIENHQIINDYLKLGSRRFGFQQLAKGKIGLFVKSEFQFVLDKFRIGGNPYWPIDSYLKFNSKKYDMSIAYAGIHNFIAYYTLEKTQARKKVLWIHFDIEKVISDFSFGRKYYQFFNQIFCVSDNVTGVFKKRFPLFKDEVFTFNNIINRQNLLVQAESGGTYSDGFMGFRIVTLGRISEEKGQQMIPHIVKRLKDAKFNFRWYLIGEGILFSTLENEIKRLNISDHLILLGRQLNPYPFLKDCDLYVQTSLHEGYCITLKEAKVFQKPIVTTNFLSASNLITNNEDGLIVEISEQGIYEGVKTLLEDEELRNKFVESDNLEVDYEKNIARLLNLEIEK